MSEKVYCKDCKYRFFKTSIVDGGVDCCIFYSNVVDTYFHQRVEAAFCENVNKNNDCEAFTKKGSIWERVKGVFK